MLSQSQAQSQHQYQPPRRSAAGEAAIARRASELDRELRVLLGAIDGRRSETSLNARFGTLLDVEAAIGRLQAAGLIERPAAAAAAAAAAPALAAVTPAPPAPRAPAAAVVPPFDLVSARKMAVFGITECMGPYGDNLALEIERCKQRAEFAPLHAKVVAAIRTTCGPAEVERFLRWSPTPPKA